VVESGGVQWARADRKVLDEYHCVLQDGEAVQATAPGTTGIGASTISYSGTIQ
jgi:hypothetical protein